MLPRLHACSEPPALHTLTSALQRVSRVPCLHIYTFAARLQTSGGWPLFLHACSAPPELHTSPSTRLRRSCRAPKLQNSMPSRRDTCINPPDLQSSMPPLLHRCSTHPYLHTSTSPRRHASRVPELHTSLPQSAAHLQAAYLDTPPSFHLQRASRAPCFHISTPVAHLEGFRASGLQVATPTVRLQPQAF